MPSPPLTATKVLVPKDHRLGVSATNFQIYAQNNAHRHAHCPHSHLRQLALPQRHAISDHFLHVVALGSRR